MSPSAGRNSTADPNGRRDAGAGGWRIFLIVGLAIVEQQVEVTLAKTEFGRLSPLLYVPVEVGHGQRIGKFQRDPLGNFVGLQVSSLTQQRIRRRERPAEIAPGLHNGPPFTGRQPFRLNGEAK